MTAELQQTNDNRQVLHVNDNDKGKPTKTTGEQQKKHLIGKDY